MPRKKTTQIALPSVELTNLTHPGIDHDTSSLVNEIHLLHDSAAKIMANLVVTTVDLGDKLILLKKKVPYGAWESFMENAFSTISIRSLQRYMDIARFVADNTELLRDFLAESDPRIKVQELSDRDVLQHLTWDAFQKLYKHTANSKKSKPPTAGFTPVLNGQIARCIIGTLGTEIDELFTDVSFSSNEITIASVHSPVPKKSLDIKGSSTLILAKNSALTSDCLSSLRASMPTSARMLIIAPLHFLSERAYAELPHVLLHGVSVLTGCKDSTDYFIGFVGRDEQSHEKFMQLASRLGTLCVPVATQQVVNATDLLAIKQ